MELLVLLHLSVTKITIFVSHSASRVVGQIARNRTESGRNAGWIHNGSKEDRKNPQETTADVTV